MFGVEMPAQSSRVSLSSARLELDTWGTTVAEPGRDPIAALIDAPTAPIDTARPAATLPIATCTPRVQQTTLPINIPYRDDAGTKRLEVHETARRLAPSPSQMRAVGLEFLGLEVPEQHDTVLEASWNGALPRDPVVFGYRRFEFTWRRHCLTGEWSPGEKAPADHSWSASCPRATIDELLPCELVDQPDRSICRYACAIDRSAPALHLPASVRFERFRMREDAQQLLYTWRDRLAFSGQELSSFVAQADQKIAVDIGEPGAWRSHTGNEIERIDVAVDSSERSQVIPIGDVEPPPWTVIAAPTATCRSQFAVEIVGARQFTRRDLGLDRRGHLVLASPSAYGDLLHVAFSAGPGILVPNDPGVGFRGEPLVDLAVGVERYFEQSWWGHTLSGSLEASIVYEPTFTAYGAMPGPFSAQTRPVNVPYHRGMIELAATVWFRNRDWTAGVLGGPGIGGPIWDHGIVEQVGALHRFWYAGLLGRFNPFSLSRHAAVELDVGIRWGETHEYFGVDGVGAADPERFHGDSLLVEHRLRQLYGTLRWRVAFR
jgi:hypothetical protein